MDLKTQIIETRNAVRVHRDQIGDYRCWVDDEVLYFQTLPELKNQKPVLPCSEEFLNRCQLYFENRQDPNETTEDIPLDSRLAPLNLSYDNILLDAELSNFKIDKLTEHLATLLDAIRAHRALEYSRRSYKSDQELYLSLPEKQLAQTKLPPRKLFLGRGCPDYNEHCQNNPKDFSEGLWYK